MILDNNGYQDSSRKPRPTQSSAGTSRSVQIPETPKQIQTLKTLFSKTGLLFFLAYHIYRTMRKRIRSDTGKKQTFFLNRKRRRGKMRKIIFLDIDGVINCKTTKEKGPEEFIQ